MNDNTINNSKKIIRLDDEERDFEYKKESISYRRYIAPASNILYCIANSMNLPPEQAWISRHLYETLKRGLEDLY